MANRFDRLFQLTPNQYIEGSPIILAAGALLKDNETGSIIAQLKFQSVSDKHIKAVKVSLSAFDISKAEVQGVSDYQYLEMNISNGQDFGGNKAIVMPSPVTRSFAVASIVVVFQDGSMWEYKEQLAMLPTAQSLSFMLNGAELEKQYRIATNERAKYIPVEDKGIWQCSCGVWNSGTICTHCRIAKNKVFSALDITILTEHMNIRLAAIAEQKRGAAEKETERKAAQQAKQKSMIKKLKIATAIIVPVIVVALLFSHWLWPDVIQPSITYSRACALMEKGNYQDAIDLFQKIYDYRDSGTQIQTCETSILDGYYNQAIGLMEQGSYQDAATLFEKTAKHNYKDSADKINHIVTILMNHSTTSTVSAGFDHVVGLRNDGTVVAAGSNSHGKCNVDSWKNIIAVSAGANHTVGLKADGTVVATGDNDYGQCNVSGWRNIVAIYAGCYHTVGLTKDGKVVGTGDYYAYGPSGYDYVSDWSKVLSGWNNILAVGAGDNFTVGIRNNNTVVFVGEYEDELKISTWRNIHTIAVGSAIIVGLQADGKVVAVGYNKDGQCNVSDWTCIITVSASTSHTVGIRANGQVVAVGCNEHGECDVAGWENIIAIVAGNHFAIGLKSDGTVVATGENDDGQCNVSEWTDIRIPN